MTTNFHCSGKIPDHTFVSLPIGSKVRVTGGYSLALYNYGVVVQFARDYHYMVEFLNSTYTRLVPEKYLEVISEEEFAAASVLES